MTHRRYTTAKQLGCTSSWLSIVPYKVEAADEAIFLTERDLFFLFLSFFVSVCVYVL